VLHPRAAKDDGTNGVYADDQLIPAGFTWVATVIFFVLLVVKILAVSHGSTTTALALLTSSNAATVVLGTVAVSFGGVLGFAFVVLAFLRLSGRGTTGERAVLLALLLFLWVLLSIFAWWGWFLVGLFYFDEFHEAAARLTLRYTRSGRRMHAISKRLDDNVAAIQKRRDYVGERVERGEDATTELDVLRAELAENEAALEESEAYLAQSEALVAEAKALVADSKAKDERDARKIARLERRVSFLQRGTLLVFGVGADLEFFLPTPWLPPQRIGLNDGTVSVGYVIRDTDDTLLLLRDEQRDVVSIPAADVDSSGYCSTRRNTPAFLASLLELATSYVSYPDCYPKGR
jgi:hypothetical protein